MDFDVFHNNLESSGYN